MKNGFHTFPDWKFDLIPLSMEKYASVRVRIPYNDKYVTLNFIDSYQFTNSSLAKLVKICPHFHFTNTLNVSDDVKFGKGVFPYSYMNNIEKLDETTLPSIDCFFDDLNNEPCTEINYARAQKAWE